MSDDGLLSYVVTLHSDFIPPITRKEVIVRGASAFEAKSIAFKENPGWIVSHARNVSREQAEEIVREQERERRRAVLDAEDRAHMMKLYPDAT